MAYATSLISPVYPLISEDGKTVIYRSEAHGDLDIHVVSADDVLSPVCLEEIGKSLSILDQVNNAIFRADISLAPREMMNDSSLETGRTFGTTHSQLPLRHVNGDYVIFSIEETYHAPMRIRIGQGKTLADAVIAMQIAPEHVVSNDTDSCIHLMCEAVGLDLETQERLLIEKSEQSRKNDVDAKEG